MFSPAARASRRRRDMASARSPALLTSQCRRSVGNSRADLGMRNVQGGAKLRQPHRILHLAHHLRRVAKERQTLRDKLQEFGAILESGAIDEAARRHASRQALQARPIEAPGVNPVSRPPSISRLAAQKPRVSKSSKKSATSGRNPARRAAAAKARAEGAAIRIAAPASGDLTRETEGIAKIEADCLGRRRHRAETMPDSVLYFTSPIASGPIPRLPPASSTPFAMRSSPSIPAGGTALTSPANEQGFGRRKHRCRQNLHSRRRRAKRDFLAG